MFFEIQRDAGGGGFIVQAPDKKMHFATDQTLASVVTGIISDPKQPKQSSEPAKADTGVNEMLVKKLGRFLTDVSYREE